MGKSLDEKKLKAEKLAMIDDASKKSTAWYSSSEGWDDGVIDPRETRNYLGFSLAIVYNQPIKGANTYGVFRM